MLVDDFALFDDTSKSFVIVNVERITLRGDHSAKVYKRHVERNCENKEKLSIHAVEFEKLGEDDRA